MTRLEECLKEKNISTPKIEGNSHASALAAIFDQIREFQVKHEDFRIDMQIGFGTSGHVYLAHQISNNRKVAIKQLNSTKLNDSEVEYLRREIAVLRIPTTINLLNWAMVSLGGIRECIDIVRVENCGNIKMSKAGLV